MDGIVQRADSRLDPDGMAVNAGGQFSGSYFSIEAVQKNLTEAPKTAGLR
jgi:hypothetical protein